MNEDALSSRMRSIFQLMLLMMGRWPSKPVDAVFVFGRAQGDWEAGDGDVGILETAAELYRSGLTRFIVIPSQPANTTFSGNLISTTFPGPEVWGARLMDLEVPPNAILFPGPYECHTRAEGDAFVELAKSKRWKTGVAVMQPHQFLRAMLGLLKSFELHCHRMRIVPVSPVSVHWQKWVYGSQGKQCLTRYTHALLEWDRVEEWQGKGKLATFDELETYLLNESL